MELKEMIKVMEHFDNGGDIECSKVGQDSWKIVNNPCWDWYDYNYRIKKPNVTIEKWLCQNNQGDFIVFETTDIDEYYYKKVKLLETYEVEL